MWYNYINSTGLLISICRISSKEKYIVKSWRIYIALSSSLLLGANNCLLWQDDAFGEVERRVWLLVRTAIVAETVVDKAAHCAHVDVAVGVEVLDVGWARELDQLRAHSTFCPSAREPLYVLCKAENRFCINSYLFFLFFFFNLNYFNWTF